MDKYTIHLQKMNQFYKKYLEEFGGLLKQTLEELDASATTHEFKKVRKSAWEEFTILASECKSDLEPLEGERAQLYAELKQEAECPVAN